MAKYKFKNKQEVKTDLGYEGIITERKCSLFTLFKPVYIVKIQKTANTAKGSLSNTIEIKCSENQLEAILKQENNL